MRSMVIVSLRVLSILITVSPMLAALRVLLVTAFQEYNQGGPPCQTPRQEMALMGSPTIQQQLSQKLPVSKKVSS